MNRASEQDIARLESKIHNQIAGRVYDVRLDQCDGGLILRGLARTYHARHLAQQALSEATDLPIAANEIIIR